MIYLGSIEQILIGVLSICFIGFMLFASAGISRTVVENISSRFRQTSMAKEIEEANRLLRDEIAEKKAGRGGTPGKRGSFPRCRRKVERSASPYQRRRRDPVCFPACDGGLRLQPGGFDRHGSAWDSTPRRFADHRGCDVMGTSKPAQAEGCDGARTTQRRRLALGRDNDAQPPLGA